MLLKEGSHPRKRRFSALKLRIHGGECRDILEPISETPKKSLRSTAWEKQSKMINMSHMSSMSNHVDQVYCGCINNTTISIQNWKLTHDYPDIPAFQLKSGPQAHGDHGAGIEEVNPPSSRCDLHLQGICSNDLLAP